MGEKKFPQVVIWDEICTVPRHILEMFINYLLEQKYQVICCEDDIQPPLFFEEMPHSWLKERADYYEEQNNRVQSDLFCEVLPVTEKWEYLEGEWKPSDRILSAKRWTQTKLPCSDSQLIQKKELVKNDIIHLPLNTLPDKFLQDMLEKEKAIDWEFGYAMTIHTSQGMTLKSLQRVWVIDKNLAWDNLIYLTVEIEEAKKKRRLKHELRPSIQEKFIRYMGQNKKKGCKFDLTVDYILTLKRIQEDRCALCLIEIKFEWDQPGDISQWTVDQIHNNWGYIKGNVRLTCLLCNQNHRV
ncbi:hypothetical protein RhiirA5_434977 [Rhizophagus irregularis]|uniref:Uncharacterized protein n=1 Tax=Rhizophagus irregularis TaxID=588596 RepID=A0A2N0NP48_9GLOM|nr:hypothetical protein RhiirA5_434977 [Rhizophagus irregularis]